MIFSTHKRNSHQFYLDLPLVIGICLLMMISLFTLYSAGGQETMEDQALRFGIGFIVMFITLFIPLRLVKTFAPFAYLVTLILLALVPFIGVEVNGAKRWLRLGMQIQPSEIAKLSLPIMLAYLLGSGDLPIKFKMMVASVLIIALPVGLVYIEPDLGTSILVALSGLAVLFLAGLTWQLIFSFVGLVAVAAPFYWFYGIKDYQRDRILTFLHPENDPFGTGYNIIQSQIAIGSGGTNGKGFMQGTQSQLEFLPERTTDFVFAVFSEEFGFIGVSMLFFIYFFILLRGFWLAMKMNDNFSRLLSGALLVTFFVYFFVNVGMVTGILPVVGLPLPFISYGGTSTLTLMLSFGLIMSLYGSKHTIIPKKTNQLS